MNSRSLQAMEGAVFDQPRRFPFQRYRTPMPARRQVQTRLIAGRDLLNASSFP
jgi:hypothetical protein